MFFVVCERVLIDKLQYNPKYNKIIYKSKEANKALNEGRILNVLLLSYL